MSNKRPDKPKRILMLVDGLDITNGVSVTAEEIAKHWSIVGSGYQLMVYGTSVVTLKDKTYADACIRVEKSIMRIPVIGYKRMWLSIPVFELMKLFLSKDYDVIHSAPPRGAGGSGAGSPAPTPGCSSRDRRIRPPPSRRGRPGPGRE